MELRTIIPILMVLVWIGVLVVWIAS